MREVLANVINPKDTVVMVVSGGKGYSQYSYCQVISITEKRQDITVKFVNGDTKFKFDKYGEEMNKTGWNRVSRTIYQVTPDLMDKIINYKKIIRTKKIVARINSLFDGSVGISNVSYEEIANEIFDDVLSIKEKLDRLSTNE